MIGLDTNVLARYLLKDDPEQFREAVRRIEHHAKQGETFAIAPVVLCELVWVLESAYQYPRSEIADILERILRTSQFEVLNKDSVWEAWDDYRAGKGDYADYLIGQLHDAAGADRTLTFDRDLKSSPLFEVLTARSRQP